MSVRRPFCVVVVWTVTLAVVVAPGGRAPVASAQETRRALTKSEKEQVLEHHKRGTMLYKAGKWQEAIEEYQKAYLVSEDPVMLYNMAQANRFWGRLEEAVRLYKVYLRDAPDAPNRTDVEARIAELQRQIAEQKAAPSSSPAPAPLPSPAVPPTPPPLSPTPQQPSVPPSASVVVDRDPAPGSGRRIVGWSMIGVTGAFLATSVVLALMAGAKAREVEDDAKSMRPFNPDTEKAGKALSGGAIVTALLGLAAGATGSYLLISGRPSGPNLAHAPRGRDTRASVAPLVGPGLAGAAARLTF